VRIDGNGELLSIDESDLWQHVELLPAAVAF
jgi:hypothetical protein